MKKKLKKQLKQVNYEYKRLKNINTRGMVWFIFSGLLVIIISLLAVLVFANKYNKLRSEYEQSVHKMELEMDSLSVLHHIKLEMYKTMFEQQQQAIDKYVNITLRNMEKRAMQEARTEAGKVVNRFLHEQEQAFLENEKE